MGQNLPKPPKIGPIGHIPAKMQKSYNGSVSKTISPTVQSSWNLKLNRGTRGANSKIQN